MLPVLKLHNVNKTYGEREVLKIENLIIPEGKITGIIGANGSGKTTLIRIMGLLIIADNGQIDIMGQKVRWNNDLVLKLRRQMSMVTQTSYMFEGSVYYNVAYGLKVRKTRESKIRRAVGEALEMVGMHDFIKANARTLSGGERQKVAIARALTVQPKILFLDEPTSSIDPTSGLEIEKYICRINQEYNTTIVVITHNLFQTRRITDEVMFMHEGKLIEKGITATVFQRPQDERTRAFITGEV